MSIENIVKPKNLKINSLLLIIKTLFFALIFNISLLIFTLPRILLFTPVHTQLFGSFAHINCDILHFGKNFLEKFNPILILQVFVKICVRKFIGTFEFIVILKLFLNCIICEMNLWGSFIHSEFRGRSSYVALFIPVKSLTAKDLHTEHITPDIKFSALIEHRLDVFLQN